MTDFVNNLLGTAFSDGMALAVFAAMVLVAGLLIWLLLKAVRQPGFAGRRGKNARIAITDATRIDDRRRLVLVRRDDVEHLILIGGANDVLVETDIRRTAPARERVDVALPQRAAVTAKPAPAQAQAPAPVPDPTVIASASPEPSPASVVAAKAQVAPVAAPSARPTPAAEPQRTEPPAVQPAAPKAAANGDGDDLDNLLKGFGATRT